MIKRASIFLVLAGLALLFASLNLRYPDVHLLKVSYTFMIFAGVYLFYKISESIVMARIKDLKKEYFFRKTISLLYWFTVVAAVIWLWVENTQVLLVSYGLVAAGIAIAFQDFFKSLLGGIMIFSNNLYRVGDRVEIESKTGDVIDIGILYTTILEIKEWVDGDQPTGRLTLVPNSAVLKNPVNNYTKDNEFIWDEITLPITYSSNWIKAKELILDIVKKESKKAVAASAQRLKRLRRKYYLTERSTEASIYMRLTDNWIMFNIRYITEARIRRDVHNEISQKILEKISKAKDITIASATMEIVGFPEVRVKKTGKNKR